MKNGTTKECLNDFFRRFPHSRALTAFARISPNTEGRWRNHGTMPKGEILLRVRCFLSLCGYEVSELTALSPLLFETGQCIAVGSLNCGEVSKELRMPNNDQLLEYLLRGGVHPSSERIQILERMTAEKRDALKDGLTKAKERLTQEGIAGGIPAKNGEVRSEKLIAEFEAICEDALRLAIDFRNGSLELRAAMRRRMASGSEPLLHRTWEALNRLIQEQTAKPQFSTKGSV